MAESGWAVAEITRIGSSNNRHLQHSLIYPDCIGPSMNDIFRSSRPLENSLRNVTSYIINFGKGVTCGLKWHLFWWMHRHHWTSKFRIRAIWYINKVLDFTRMLDNPRRQSSRILMLNIVQEITWVMEMASKNLQKLAHLGYCVCQCSKSPHDFREFRLAPTKA